MSTLAGSVVAINARVPYKSGGILSNDATTPNTLLHVSALQCSDAFNVYDIINTATDTVISTAITGVNGIDTAAIAVSSDYAVYAIADAENRFPPAYILSLNTANNPGYPNGYNICRQIMWVKTDSSGNIIKFWQFNNEVMWDSPIVVRASATVTNSFVDNTLTLTAGMPPQALSIYLGGVWTPATAGNIVYVRPTGSASTNGLPLASGPVVSQAFTIGSVRVATAIASGVPKIDVKGTAATTDNLALSINGFVYVP